MNTPDQRNTSIHIPTTDWHLLNKVHEWAWPKGNPRRADRVASALLNRWAAEAVDIPRVEMVTIGGRPAASAAASPRTDQLDGPAPAESDLD